MEWLLCIDKTLAIKKTYLALRSPVVQTLSFSHSHLVKIKALYVNTEPQGRHYKACCMWWFNHYPACTLSQLPKQMVVSLAGERGGRSDNIGIEMACCHCEGFLSH